MTINSNCTAALADDLKYAIEGGNEGVSDAQARMVETEEESDLEEESFGLDGTMRSDPEDSDEEWTTN